MHPDDIIRLQAGHYILATSPRADVRSLSLKHDETFGVFDRFGDIVSAGTAELGIYHKGTRYLSRLEFLVQDRKPLLLSSGIKEDNVFLSVDLTNPDIQEGGEVVLQRDSVHILRSKFIWEGNCFECIYLTNFSLEPIDIRIKLLFSADFADIFEVRGVKRQQRGRFLPVCKNEKEVIFGYIGLDGVKRTTKLMFFPAPVSITHESASFEFRLMPRQREVLHITVQCAAAGEERPVPEWKSAFMMASRYMSERKARGCKIHTSNERFNAWCDTSLDDIHLLLTRTEHGLYPYAGVPWYNTPFGRDGIITALQSLWFEPEIAKGVLSYLSATQAKTEDPERDAEPGKILHERRQGEMSATGEVPFGMYYGSVDATPLFVFLAGQYYRRTGDVDFIRGLWDSLKLAIQWIDVYGDSDGDGFVEYKSRSEKGLTNQGWKDSADAVFHEDGSLPEGPIALCEVQGYVYAAKMEAALLAEVLGEREFSEKLSREARSLKEKFEQFFWLEDLGTYALALDGMKKPCRVRASNAGHCLFAGIVSEERARRVAETLMSADFYSGWGIRTLAVSEARYNPMSYHNGSVWPHDNAVIAKGFARYAISDKVLKIFEGLFDSAVAVGQYRLPELFCGFHRRPMDSPTLYPVACLPQAWASGAVFMLLEACIGLSFEQPDKIIFRRPVLPVFLREVYIRDLMFGNGSIDVILRRHKQDVSVEVTKRTGSINVMVLK